ncbi:hypothetical protein Zm00014a_038635 [Zea mays]|nr:hypothetical protein Zm00014a_038635 [Zea mays]
MFCTKYT